jgi:hypothetical protein
LLGHGCRVSGILAASFCHPRKPDGAAERTIAHLHRAEPSCQFVLFFNANQFVEL